MPLATLKELRKSFQMSLREVQERTGIAAPHLSEIERGIRMAKPEQLEMLSELYEVDAESWRYLLVQEF